MSDRNLNSSWVVIVPTAALIILTAWGNAVGMFLVSALLLAVGLWQLRLSPPHGPGH